jgi:hypothetical protein
MISLPGGNQNWYQQDSELVVGNCPTNEGGMSRDEGEAPPGFSPAGKNG